MKISIFFAATIISLSAKASSLMPNLACLGSSLDLQDNSNIPLVNLSYKVKKNDKKSEGWFLVDTGTNFSSLDKTLVTNSTGSFDSSIEEINFFVSINPFKVFLEDFERFRNSTRQIGLIGNDLISKSAYAFDFTKRRLYRSNFSSACDPETLTRVGLTSMPTDGYFSSDPAEEKLFPLEHIRPSIPNSKHLTVANSPVIPIRIGNTDAVAMIDSGFDDKLYAFSVNINSALLTLANKRKETLIRAKDIPSITLSSCVKGEKINVIAYRLLPGESLQLVSGNGAVIRTYKECVFFVKLVPPSARTCGGIGTWEIPAAQLGASFLKSFGTSVFNAQTHTVWITRQ